MKEDDEENYEPFKTQGEQIVAFKPGTNKYVPVHDATEEMKRDSEKYAPNGEQRQAFYQRRIELIESSDTLDDDKNELLQDLRLSAQQEKSSAHKNELLQDLNQSALAEESNAHPEDPPDPRPIPGGVGYGAFYIDGKLTFSNSSVLYYSIVTVQDIGDDSNKWLYLTSTNRSPKGVEAYVSYQGQNEPTFTVFDWSKTGDARWALSKPYSQLSDYLIAYDAGGHQYQTINVANSTRRVEGTETRWKNEVMLYNRISEAYDLIYLNEYDLPASEEHKCLWWGPIIETFAPFPYSTNVVGFFDAQLLQDGASPRLLTADVTQLRKDHAGHPGFQLVFDQPNYSFLVRWT